MRFRVVVREEALSASRTVIHACTGSAPRTKRAFAEASRSLVVCGFLGVAMLASPGCASAHGESPLVDPDAFGSDLGTLISIADVRRVSDEMIQAMNASDTLAELRRAPPLSIRLGLFRQFTTITNFNKRLFTNRLVAELKRATGGASIRFFEPLETSDPLINSRTGDPA
ncbi:MAG TPA: hypothetical protein VK116_16795, partial [Planctomycetota bacterium]|nr:hypothetical protein [Planctomycetota bacterium]